jgi:predicted metal-dependent hydrolase
MPTLTIGKTEIEYTIRRSDRVKRQRIIVTPKDVEVAVPLAKSLREIEAFVHSRRRWIFDEREKMRETLAASPWPDHFVTGAKVPYRGRRIPLTVKTVPGHTIVTGYRNGFHVDIPQSVASEDRDWKVKYVLELWLRRTMENDALAFVRRYSRKLGQEPKAVRIKDQKHLWGSCGIDRIINLNWRLIFMPKPILEYAVVHELCHLEHRHHSSAFWSLVKTMLPDYERRKAWLEQHGAGYDL